MSETGIVDVKHTFARVSQDLNFKVPQSTAKSYCIRAVELLSPDWLSDVVSDCQASISSTFTEYATKPPHLDPRRRAGQGRGRSIWIIYSYWRCTVGRRKERLLPLLRGIGD